LRILVINQLQVIFVKLVSNRLIIEVNEGSFIRFVVNSNGTGSVLKRAFYVCQLFDPHSIATIHVNFSCFGCVYSINCGVRTSLKIIDQQETNLEEFVTCCKLDKRPCARAKPDWAPTSSVRDWIGHSAVRLSSIDSDIVSSKLFRSVGSIRQPWRVDTTLFQKAQTIRAAAENRSLRLVWVSLA
jgi:hypothetical protein